jgi:hypothetical protein
MYLWLDIEVSGFYSVLLYKVHPRFSDNREAISFNFNIFVCNFDTDSLGSLTKDCSAGTRIRARLHKSKESYKKRRSYSNPSQFFLLYKASTQIHNEFYPF